MALTPQEKQALLEVARRSIETKLAGKSPPAPPADAPAGKQGAFVTLHAKDRLRGCIGTFVGAGPLHGTVADMARAAAFDDPRFAALCREEYEDVDVEISVLSPLRRVDSVEEIEVGRHGIYITCGPRRGVLLPQVATENRWDRKTFLEHTCMKAGLPLDAWKDPRTVIEVFEAEVFGER